MHSFFERARWEASEGFPRGDERFDGEALYLRGGRRMNSCGANRR